MTYVSQEALYAIQRVDPDGGEVEPTQAVYEAFRLWVIRAYGHATWEVYRQGGWGRDHREGDWSHTRPDEDGQHTLTLNRPPVTATGGLLLRVDDAGQERPFFGPCAGLQALGVVEYTLKIIFMGESL